MRKQNLSVRQSDGLFISDAAEGMFTLQHHFLGKDAGKTVVGALLMTMDAELHGFHSYM